MYHKHLTEGLVIKNFDTGDSSRKIALFAREFGLVYAHAQNSRSLKSKLRPSIQEFASGRFVLVKGFSGWRVIGASEAESIFDRLKNNRAKLAIVGNIFNLIKATFHESGDNHQTFDALKRFLTKLPDLSDSEARLAEYATLLKLMSDLGYLKEESKFSAFLKDFELEKSFLEVLRKNKDSAVRMINQSLKALEIKM